MFYEAMSIFVSKHFKGSSVALFSTSIKMAIWLRALLTLIKSFFTRLGLAIIDTIVIFLSIWAVKKVWVVFIRQGNDFIQDIVFKITPVYVIVFLLAAALAGMYDTLYKPVKALAATFIAVIAA